MSTHTSPKTSRSSTPTPPTIDSTVTSKSARSVNSGSVSNHRLRRMASTTVCLPIVYGSVAQYLDKKKTNKEDEYSTHEWTLYVKSPSNDDLSKNSISKVIFHLHPSFPQPIREITSSPFEVTERGWGEFEATISIHWIDITEKPLVLTHGIKLYPPGLQHIINSTVSPSKEPVVHEFYDEVVFTDPTESFYESLMMRVPLLLDTACDEPKYNKGIESSFDGKNKGTGSGVCTDEQKITEVGEKALKVEDMWNDEATVKILLAAQRFLQDEIAGLKSRLIHADEEKFELDLLVQQKAAEAVSAAVAASGSAAAMLPSSPGPTVASSTADIAQKQSSKSHSGKTSSGGSKKLSTGGVGKGVGSKSGSKKSKSGGGSGVGNSKKTKTSATK